MQASATGASTTRQRPKIHDQAANSVSPPHASASAIRTAPPTSVLGRRCGDGQDRDRRARAERAPATVPRRATRGCRRRAPQRIGRSPGQLPGDRRVGSRIAPIRAALHDHGGAAGRRPVDRLVGQRVGDASSGRAARAPPSSARSPPSVCRARGPERDELGVLDPPAAGELLDDQLRIEQQVDLATPRARGRARARARSPVYSATLLVWTPR